MKIFCDWHHGGLGRSLFLLLQHRLGHDVYFPSGEFANWANSNRVGTWLTPGVASAGGVPDHHLNQHGELKNVISKEEFMAMDWDAVVITRPESEVLFRQLIAEHRLGLRIKRIGQAGNEGTYYDWNFVPNFLSSDYLSFLRCPGNVNKIHYMQEVGHQFQPQEFVPLREDNLTKINTFINCLNSFTRWNWDKDQSWWDRRCPHCDGNTGIGEVVSVYDIWGGMKRLIPTYEFRDFGINNVYGSVNEKTLPYVCTEGALTWCFKTYEGMGHSIAQSIALGRLCLVPRRFHKYRTASQFLIPNLTCFEADWNAESCAEVIKWFTSSLQRANIYSKACFDAAKGIFNWEKEAFRVKEFLEKLQ